MKTKCYPVKIKSITPCGGAYLIEDYNGNKDFFPKSTVFENGYETFIAVWILEKKSINYSFCFAICKFFFSISLFAIFIILCPREDSNLISLRREIYSFVQISNSAAWAYLF